MFYAGTGSAEQRGAGTVRARQPGMNVPQLPLAMRCCAPSALHHHQKWPSSFASGTIVPATCAGAAPRLRQAAAGACLRQMRCWQRRIRRWRRRGAGAARTPDAAARRRTRPSPPGCRASGAHPRSALSAACLRGAPACTRWIGASKHEPARVCGSERCRQNWCAAALLGVASWLIRHPSPQAWPPGACTRSAHTSCCKPWPRSASLRALHTTVGAPRATRVSSPAAWLEPAVIGLSAVRPPRSRPWSYIRAVLQWYLRFLERRVRAHAPVCRLPAHARALRAPARRAAWTCLARRLQPCRQRTGIWRTGNGTRTIWCAAARRARHRCCCFRRCVHARARGTTFAGGGAGERRNRRAGVVGRRRAEPSAGCCRAPHLAAGAAALPGALLRTASGQLALLQ